MIRENYFVYYQNKIKNKIKSKSLGRFIAFISATIFIDLTCFYLMFKALSLTEQSLLIEKMLMTFLDVLYER